MQPYKRSDRVRKLIHQSISQLLREIKDPRVGFVTVIDVKLSDDLLEARVYYSVLGDKKIQEDTAEGLARATSFLRRRLGDELTLRKIPSVQFLFDDTYERAERVFTLLNKISAEQEKTDSKDQDDTEGPCRENNSCF